MRKYVLGFLAVILSISLCGCSSNTLASKSTATNHESANDIDTFAEEIDTNEFVMKNRRDVLDCLSENGYPDLPLLLEEAWGNSSATKMIFDFAEEIGYCPSAIYGKYCFDTEKNVIHITDSDCVSNIPYEKRVSCLVYKCFSKEDVQNAIEKNQYLAQFNFQFCQTCCSD